MTAPHAQEQFTVDGWTYFTSDECSDDDVRKLTHFAVNGATGDTREISLTPYQTLESRHLRTLILMDFPPSTGIGNFTVRDIEQWQVLMARLTDAAASHAAGTGAPTTHGKAPVPHYQEIADAEYAARKAGKA